MTGFRKSYFEELGRIQERFQSLFEEVLLRAGVAGETAGGSGAPPGGWSPAVDVLETGDAFLLDAELPGVAEDDVDLTVEGRRLQLAGRRRRLPPDRAFARMERSYGSFQRVFELPEAVDADRISASLERGVLRVKLPKRRPERSRPSRPPRSGGERIDNEGGP
ncbi:MAG: Hsp20/alpha crystallin family protein [Acidobacteriota bacterium]